MNKLIYFKIMAVLLACMVSVQASGYDFVQDGIYYNITGSNTVEVTYKDKNFNYYSGSVTIPSSVTFNGTTYTVTGIGNYAFMQSPDLTAISIPSTVTYLGYAACYNCTSLTSVNFPSNVTSLGEFCFQNCSALTTVRLNDTQLTTIPRQCFMACTALQTLTLPSTLTLIDSFTFYQCESLASVNLPVGLQTLNPSSFADCSSLTQVYIPSSVNLIYDNVFNGCQALVAITVNSANSNYSSIDGVLFNKTGDALIAYPNMHAQSYSVPDGVSVIMGAAFEGCNNVTRVTLPLSLKRIEGNAFTDCINLQSISIPSGVEYIGSAAFIACKKLSSVTIPPSVTYIGDAAFALCDELQSIYVESTNAHYKSDLGVLYTKDGLKLLQYPCGRPDKHYSVENGTDTIGDRAFAYSNVKSVYLPKSVKALDYSTFMYSTVERVVIDEGLTTIPMNTFYECEHLQSIYLPSTIQSIDNQAFAYTLNLSQITIAVNGNAPTLGSNVFYGMGYDLPDQTVTVYVPNGMAGKYSGLDGWLDGIASYSDIVPIAAQTEFTVDSLIYKTSDALLNATVTGVTSKTLTDPGIPPKVAYQGNLCTVTALGYSSLQNCTRMVRAEVPFTVTWMDDYSFYGCTNIATLILNNGLKQIDPFSLSHINQLKTLQIPASVDSISGTFVNYSSALKNIFVESGNTKYTSLSGVLFSKDKTRLVAFPDGKTSSYTVPDGTVIIGSSSFRGALQLQEVILPKTLRSIEGSAFFDDQGLTHIEVPTGVETIGNSAFGGCTGITTVELPSTLTSLGYNAFYNVPNLTSLTVKSTTPPTCVTHIDPRTHDVYIPFMEAHFTGCTLYVPRGCKAAYQAANIWKNFTNIVEIDVPIEAARGDVNQDGQVNISDVTSLIDLLLSSDGTTSETADVNLDGNVNISDVTALIDYLLGGEWPATVIDMWYLIGDHVGSQPLENQGQSSIGRGLIPLYPVGSFDEYGKGQLTYVGYFGADDAVMLIHHPGSYDDCWGKKPNGVFGHGGEEITRIKTGADGYFVISLNTQTDQFLFYPYTPSDQTSTFESINIVGSHSYWAVSDPTYNMTGLNPNKENHNWTFKNFQIRSDGEMKFAANNEWDFNWGATAFPWGTGERNGLNVPVKAGTYDVYFNDLTGDYHFSKK